MKKIRGTPREVKSVPLDPYARVMKKRTKKSLCCEERGTRGAWALCIENHLREGYDERYSCRLHCQREEESTGRS